MLVLLRGMLRIFAGSLVLCLSGYAAYLAWRHAPTGSFAAATWVVPLIAGALAFLLLRLVLRFVVRPFDKQDDGDAPPRRSPVKRSLALLFSLVPASLLWFAGAAAVRSVGSVAEIRRFVDGPDADSARSAFIAELKGAIDRALPASWFKAIDPIGDEARVTLAKLIALGESSPPPKAIPVLEEPEIRALILHDPKLRELARRKRYADILRDPRLDHVMADPDLRRMLADLGL